LCKYYKRKKKVVKKRRRRSITISHCDSRAVHTAEEQKREASDGSDTSEEGKRAFLLPLALLALALTSLHYRYPFLEPRAAGR
jgi:hypothetical protein